jgi:hypothetical protein
MIADGAASRNVSFPSASWTSGAQPKFSSRGTTPNASSKKRRTRLWNSAISGMAGTLSDAGVVRRGSLDCVVLSSDANVGGSARTQATGGERSHIPSPQVEDRPRLER